MPYELYRLYSTYSTCPLVTFAFSTGPTPSSVQITILCTIQDPCPDSQDHLIQNSNSCSDLITVRNAAEPPLTMAGRAGRRARGRAGATPPRIKQVARLASAAT